MNEASEDAGRVLKNAASDAGKLGLDSERNTTTRDPDNKRLYAFGMVWNPVILSAIIFSELGKGFRKYKCLQRRSPFSSTTAPQKGCLVTKCEIQR
jgi:hypothetical protein